MADFTGRDQIGTIRVRVGCEMGFNPAWPTAAVIQVMPRREIGQEIVGEKLETTPAAQFHEYTDLYGNLCRRWMMPPGDSTLRYDAVVELSAAQDPADPSAPELQPVDLPDEVLGYTLPSRYCLSDVLMGDAWRLFGSVEPGWGRVQAICDWVHENIRFDHGGSNPLTTAVDTYNNRVGVCRDFAHLSVTFCRALNIPARYAFGYLPDIGIETHDVMDFAAWFEVYLGDRWWTFDARNNEPRIGRAVIGRGRDALDVAMVTSYGPVGLPAFKVWADEVPTPLEELP